MLFLVLHAAGVANSPNDNFRQTVQLAEHAIFQIETVQDGKSKYGTGFAIDSEGRIATAFHLIRKAPNRGAVQVFVTRLGSQTRTEIIQVDRYDAQQDFAILRLPAGFPDQLTPLPLDNHLPDFEGRDVAVVGNPQRLPGVHLSGKTSGRQPVQNLLTLNRSGFEVILLPNYVSYYGMSGAPVVDLKTRKCIGLVLGATQRDRPLSIALPAFYFAGAQSSRKAIKDIPSDETDTYFSLPLDADSGAISSRTLRTIDAATHAPLPDVTVFVFGIDANCTPSMQHDPICRAQVFTEIKTDYTASAAVTIPSIDGMRWEFSASRCEYKDLTHLSKQPDNVIELPLERLAVNKPPLLYLVPRVLGLHRGAQQASVLALGNPIEWEISNPPADASWYKPHPRTGVASRTPPLRIEFVDGGQPPVDPSETADLRFVDKNTKALYDVLTIYPDTIPPYVPAQVTGVVRTISASDGQVWVQVLKDNVPISLDDVPIEDTGYFHIDIPDDKWAKAGLALRARGRDRQGTVVSMQPGKQFYVLDLGPSECGGR